MLIIHFTGVLACGMAKTPADSNEPIIEYYEH